MSASATTTRAPARARSASASCTASAPARSVASPRWPVRRSEGSPASAATFPSEPRRSTKISPPWTQRPVAGKAGQSSASGSLPGPHAGQQLRADVPAQRRIDLLEQARRLRVRSARAATVVRADGQSAAHLPGVGVHGDHVHAVARSRPSPGAAPAAPWCPARAERTPPPSRRRRSGRRPGSRGSRRRRLEAARCAQAPPPGERGVAAVRHPARGEVADLKLGCLAPQIVRPPDRRLAGPRRRPGSRPRGRARASARTRRSSARRRAMP